MYGTQANTKKSHAPQEFENDVKMYGTQAKEKGRMKKVMFENDVKMYGTQAKSRNSDTGTCLRMM